MRSLDDILATAANARGGVRLTQDELRLISGMAITGNQLELERGQLEADDAFILAREEARAGGLFGKAVFFTCPECGPRVKADEDGCCCMCGADCVESVGA